MYLPLIFAFLSGSLAKVPLSNVKRVTSTQLVPDRFVVELDSLSSLPSKRSVHEEFYTRLESITKRAGKNFQVVHEFNSPDLFVGASITLSGTQSLAQVAALPGVKAIRPVVRIPGPIPVKKYIPSGPNDPALPADSESTHVMTGVDKLHAQGLTGKGIKIGIIDTGTDYTNPFLGGGFGPGHKIAGGFDFVGDNFDGTNQPMPDNDPLDQCNGHGTHVAGIIGANPGNDFNISGVAYGSTIFSYRIFGCTGSVFDDIIIEALLQGVSDGMDILTLSLGGADGWTEGMASVVASRLVDNGKIVTIAAGNDGQFGSWYTSGPGNGINVISVASVDNTVVPIQNATTSDPNHPTIPYFSTLPLPFPDNLPVFATSNDTSVVDDACNPLPAGTPDLSQFLVVIRRGTCTFVQKLQNAADKGAKFMFIYDNGSGLGAIDTGNFTTALILPEDGQYLVGQFVAGAQLTVSFPQSGRSFGFPDPTGGLVSDFTSYGPTNDMFFKPAIAAPGGNILSTWPVPFGSFALLSGTSMATPFMAGSSALYLQTKGKSLSVTRGARTRFQTTAQSIPSSRTDGDPLQTLTQQGAGLVNVFNAIHFQTSVSPGELNLNDTAHFVGTQVITVQNTGSKLQVYKLSHLPAGTAQSIQPGTIFPSDGPVPLTQDFAGVRIVPSTLVVPPHGSSKAIITFTHPSNVDKTTFPVYTGFIQVQSLTSAEILHVAYQGLAANSRDLKVLDNTDTFFGVPLPTILDGQGNVQSEPTNYTFVGVDFPTLLFRLTSGTPKLVVDLVGPGLNLSKRELDERRLPSDWTPLSKFVGGTFSQIPTVGNIGEFDFISRNSDAADAADNGFSTLSISPPQFSNASVIPNGQYRILLRALKITGNPSNEADYETFLSPIIGVNSP